MKRSTSRKSMLYTMGFLFCLIAAFAVFFLGVKIGADKAEAQYAKKYPNSLAQDPNASYQESDLVTFYHSVFSPYREFKREWNDKVDRLASGTASPSQTLRSLRTLADEASSKVTETALFSNSPLLEQGQLNILKSLRLFSEAADQAAAADSAATAKELRTGELAQGAVKYGLTGQNNYYSAMLSWGSGNSSSIPSAIGNPKVISFSEWKKMPLLLKNANIAQILLNRGIFADYDPQDVTAKIDNLINSGSTDSLNLNNVQGAITLLVSTGALSEQEFSKWRLQYYSKETLPQIPFFYD
ncbi:hypothetical protein KIH86_04510 [Paenibacillus sp. HN-1]|uniref:hypothetical protein n=1 Tax=Paenibacillus TaxID=44249 RepID=UPI001CA82082|nr:MULTISPECIES: hypothetical protein [Paenibacillus]MBY9081622.1 hypothetical protein [Paenibacillus sp. CGMCC 1.18879]MBY9083491.1 hypothetical protein [Paenibacillus sinensis]